VIPTSPDHKSAHGAARDWSLEAASSELMGKKGWTRSMLKAGDQITVQGYRAKSEPTATAFPPSE
jgi:hypothetical protein